MAWVIGVLTVVVWLAMTVGAHAQQQQRTREEELLERIRILEERLDRLEKVDVIKKTTEYVCPGGEIYEELPPGGRCPDRSRPEVRETVRRSSLQRRESIAEKIESAIEEAAGKKVAIGGSLRGGLQQVLNADNGQNKLYGAGALDLLFLFSPMARTTMFVDVEAIGGRGPDQKLGSLSRLNADVETLGDNQDEKLMVREAWLDIRFFDDRLDLILGKLDPTNYFDRNAFANDETSQFLNAALVNNPMLKQPPNGPGIVGRWDTVRDLGFSLGVHALDDIGDDLSGDPYIAGEIDYHSTFLVDGNYRMWGRWGTLQDDRSQHTWGAGVSLDQLLTPRFGIFARAGFGETEDESMTSYAASTGFRLASPFWGRSRDRFGVGYSYQNEPAGDEHVAEAYYNYYFTDHFSLIGNVQWLFSGPNQVTGERNRNVIIPGVRAVVAF